MMEQVDNKTLYIFLDESGNFDFSPTGTKYYLLTCISTTSPVKNRGAFLDLKYKILGTGENQECFHATEDKQFVRDKVFYLIKGLKDFEVDSVIAQKNKTNWSLYEEPQIGTKTNKGFSFKTKRVEEKFYKQISETLLQYVVCRYISFKKIVPEKIIIIFDAIFNPNKQEFIKKHLKQYFKQRFEIVPYVNFYQVKADINCQIADYCGWALIRKWERNDLRSYGLINKKISSEFLIFETGETTYY